MKVLIVGFGLSGRSAAKVLLKQNAQVTAVDAKYQMLLEQKEVQELIQRGVHLIGEEGPFETYDTIVTSPGIPPSHPLLQQKVISEVELGFQNIKQPILGITGTNGKTTVTLLTTHILNFSGKKARALGNVGVPITSAIGTLAEDEIVVAELSSYQLEGLKGKILEASVLLNITPDHLDRYGSMEKYAEAKIQIQKITKDPACFFMGEACQKWLSHSNTIGYSGSALSTDLVDLFLKNVKICSLPQMLQHRKSHDLENFMAAFSLCFSLGVPPEIIREAYASFVKPHHRIQYIGSIHGIKFYDDSKGTNIDAVFRAVEVMEGPVHLIAGGVDKGASYLPWQAFQGKVKKIYCLGAAAPKICLELNPFIPTSIYPDMKEAVLAAFKGAISGDNILLSPGCSSFDMFTDYVDRGRCFQRCVKEIAS